MSNLTQIERTILERIGTGIHRARTFQVAKATVNGLIGRGLVERGARDGERTTYLRLSNTGRAAIDLPPIGWKLSTLEQPDPANDEGAPSAGDAK